MIGIVGTRGTGKTTALVKASAAMGIPIYCHKESQIRIIKDAAFRAGVNIPPPIAGEWRGFLASDRQRIAIDDAQMAMVETGQAELAEVMMPYMLDNQGHTLYEAMAGRMLPGEEAR